MSDLSEFYPVNEKGNRLRKPTPKPKRGRPRGSSTTRAVVTRVATSCPKCGSTDRTKFHAQPVLKGPFTFQGRVYKWLRRLRCKCTNCGQIRIEREFS